MKRLICSLVAFLMIVGSVGYAQSLDLSAFTPEQLEALQQMIDAELASKQSTGAQFTDCVSLLNAMAAAGSIVDPSRMLDYTAETDVNGLLGNLGSYSSKTDFGCLGYTSINSDYVGGTIEYFPEAEYARNRFDYIRDIYIRMPSLADQSMYLCGKYVLRIDVALSTDDIVSIVNALEDQLQQPIDDMLDPTSKINPDLLHGIVSPDPTAAPTASAATDDLPAPTASPVSIYQTLKRGSKGTGVANMQGRLKSLGYLSGLADGDFGPATEKAVRAFQAANSLEETGIATPEDQTILFNSGVVCADGSIANAYDPYEICPIELSRVDLKKSYSCSYVTFSAKNISIQHVKAVSFAVRYYDAFGDRLTSHDNSEFVVSASDIAVGKSISVSTKNNGYIYSAEAVSAEVAVTRVLMADGTNLDYHDPVWFEGK